MRRIFVGLHEVVLRFVFLNSSTHLLIYIIILSFLSLSYGIILFPIQALTSVLQSHLGFLPPALITLV